MDGVAAVALGAATTNDRVDDTGENDALASDDGESSACRPLNAVAMGRATLAGRMPNGRVGDDAGAAVTGDCCGTDNEPTTAPATGLTSGDRRYGSTTAVLAGTADDAEGLTSGDRRYGNSTADGDVAAAPAGAVDDTTAADTLAGNTAPVYTTLDRGPAADEGPASLGGSTAPARTTLDRPVGDDLSDVGSMVVAPGRTTLLRGIGTEVAPDVGDVLEAGSSADTPGNTTLERATGVDVGEVSLLGSSDATPGSTTLPRGAFADAASAAGNRDDTPVTTTLLRVAGDADGDADGVENCSADDDSCSADDDRPRASDGVAGALAVAGAPPSENTAALSRAGDGTPAAAAAGTTPGTTGVPRPTSDDTDGRGTCGTATVGAAAPVAMVDTTVAAELRLGIAGV